MIEDLTALGWAHDPSDGYIGHIGGLWIRSRTGGLEFGFLPTGIHANRNGVVHGGMLMSFIDRAFGQTARETSGAVRAATVSLSNQFIAPLKLGAFAVVTPKVIKVTTRLAFVEGIIFHDESPILTAHGVWRLARPRD